MQRSGAPPQPDARRARVRRRPREEPNVGVRARAQERGERGRPPAERERVRRAGPQPRIKFDASPDKPSFTYWDNQTLLSTSINTRGVLAQGFPVCAGVFEMHVHHLGEPLLDTPLHVRVRALERGGRHGSTPAVVPLDGAIPSSPFSTGGPAWDAGTASRWEAFREDTLDFLQRQLAPPGRQLELTPDIQAAWAMTRTELDRFREACERDVRGGVSGKYGRYLARKRAAMLHYKLDAFSAAVEAAARPP